MDSSMNGNDSKIESEFLTNLNKFRQINFFAGIPPEAVKIIAFLCQREFYQKGDVIFNQNDDDGCAYYILDGKASIFRNRYNLSDYDPG